MYHNPQNQPGTQQRAPAQPPEVLSTKDSLYVSDALSWELLAAKKAHNMAGECQDPQIRQKLEQLSGMHHQHYQVLLNHLQPQQQYQTVQAYSPSYQ